MHDILPTWFRIKNNQIITGVYINFPRALKTPDRSFFLWGPRGTGKTTFVHQEFPQAYEINLLEEGTFQKILREPEILGRILNHLPSSTSWVFIDEVQRLPSLLNEIHNFIEKRRFKFILCGSSVRKLKETQTNLLGGRASKRELYPLTAEELEDALTLEEILRFGSMPVVLAEDDREEVLRAYTEMYFRHEIQAEAIVRNLSGFARFLPIAALFHAQALNVESLARDAGVARTTVQGYLEILEDTLLAFRLPAYEGGLRVRERKHPKLYWIDNGIVRAFKNQYGPLAIEERGNLFEAWIGLNLKAVQSYHRHHDEMFYWSSGNSKETTEVDFLLKKGQKFIAIEVKSSARLRPEFYTGLRAISDLRNLERKILVYGGETSFTDPDHQVEVLTVKDFFNHLKQGLF